MDGFEKFQKAIFEVSKKIILRGWEEKQEEMGKVLQNILFGLIGPRSIEYIPSQEEKFYGVIFEGFKEIVNCHEMLLDIEAYIKKLPLKKQLRIAKHRTLRFFIEGYLHEVYILKERLISFLRKIKRLYKNDLNILFINKKLLLLENSVHASFGTIIKIRSIHTHHIRFQDNSMDQIESLYLFTKTKNKMGSFFKHYYDDKFIEIKENWVTQTIQNNIAIKTLLNLYFGELFEIIFKNGGKLLKLPKKKLFVVNK